ncbi:MAG TPA: adenylate/guanylate cyclase domain-containing protein [Roseiarcus sp.]|nr:adenylate/guanylate cyclase domain-containing protein [Roseiarcus sp.]
MSRRAQILRIVRVAAVGGVIGAAYGYFAHANTEAGAKLGAMNAGAAAAMEIFGFRGKPGEWLRQLPFRTYLRLRIAIYVAVIVAVNSIGLSLINGAAPVAFADRADVVFALAACVVGNVLVGANELLGPGVLFAFAAGRYVRPTREERALLYIDLCSSTAIAERLGEARFLDFLNVFFADVSSAIDERRGEIHKYVGDEIIATWKLKVGRGADGAIDACLEARERLRSRAEGYRRDFGLVPDFRAALHVGPVMVGELGYLKKEIALIGDAMNTADRILAACRETGHPVLASSALIERAGAPKGVLAEPLPPLKARGKAAPLELVALTRAEAKAPAPAI